MVVIVIVFVFELVSLVFEDSITCLPYLLNFQDRFEVIAEVIVEVIVVVIAEAAVEVVEVFVVVVVEAVDDCILVHAHAVVEQSVVAVAIDPAVADSYSHFDYYSSFPQTSTSTHQYSTHPTVVVATSSMNFPDYLSKQKVIPIMALFPN